ncbi:cell wall protein [Agromyces protaetiae]|uniref:Cell wall protein n=1 Tax=Agromyces protaetiae TaxID=2509455 RepID=A0A4P6FGD1_9MICO|nr:cell wall protein [Agromyces protaetiae]
MPASLLGSVATGVCEADVPWIYFHVALDDPDQQSTSREAFLVFTDGTNTERIALGEIDPVTGVLDDRVLWPGASVDGAGNPTGWPGWTQDASGEWVETTGNFAWTRSLTTATIEVNPDLAVDVSYPPATPECVSGPRGGGDGEARAAGLASTGFNGTPFAIGAGIIVLAGIAFVVISVVRKRKRA